MLHFLDELRDTLLAHYGDDIAEHYRQQREESHQTDFDFEDDIIPFSARYASITTKNYKGRKPFFSFQENKKSYPQKLR